VNDAMSQYREPERRTDIYIWVTWLTKLLAGENHCEWAVWFRARNSYTKLPSGFDLDRWTAEHSELVLRRAAELGTQGYSVRIEDQNKFSLRGSRTGATIAGKPDIVALRNGEMIFEDCKTGKQRISDHVHVALYMLLARLVPDFRGYDGEPTGRVVYADGVVPLDSATADDLSNRLASLVARISDPQAPAKAPSLRECEYCDIADFYCDERIESKSNRVYVTDVF
jgi:hypothetical protein